MISFICKDERSKPLGVNNPQCENYWNLFSHFWQKFRENNVLTKDEVSYTKYFLCETKFHTVHPSLFVLGLELDSSFSNWRHKSCHPRPRSVSRTQSSSRTLFFRSKASSSSAIFGEYVQRVRKWYRRLQKAKTWMLGWVVSARRTFVECMSNCETSSGEFSQGTGKVVFVKRPCLQS